MKKYSIIFSIALTALAFNSCNKWLEENKYGSLSVDMFNAEANIIRLVGQAYADLKWLHDHWGYWGILTLSSDEAVNPTRMPESHWADGGYWRAFAGHDWSPWDRSFENLWNTSMAGAVGCNKILQTLAEKKEVISEQLYGEYVGELEVLRTFYFFTLFDCFGRIPYTETFDENLHIPLLSVEETWHKMIACLERNAPNMKVVTPANRAELHGRVTQGFAYALLARLYLNAESYSVTVPNAMEKVIEYTEEIIASGSYQIENDFFANFSIYNEESRENIFVIVENGDANFDVRHSGNMMNKLRIVMLTMPYAIQDIYNMRLNCWNGFCAPPEFTKLYETLDETVDRRGPVPGDSGTLATGRWGWFVGEVKNPGAETNTSREPRFIRPTVSSLSAADWGDGARLWKFEIDRESKYMYCENDFPLFRYADVLYMKAEAQLRKNGTTTLLGDADFDRIRVRAGVKPYTSTTLHTGNFETELLAERGREFAWELVRRRDLIRFGKYSDPAWWATSASWRGPVRTDPFREWFPIPGAVLMRSHVGDDGENIWTQNFGY